MSLKMSEAAQATEAAIEQNGLAEGSSTSSDDESEPEVLNDTKGDEERQMDVKKEELLKVRTKIGTRS